MPNGSSAQRRGSTKSAKNRVWRNGNEEALRARRAWRAAPPRNGRDVRWSNDRVPDEVSHAQNEPTADVRLHERPTEPRIGA